MNTKALKGNKNKVAIRSIRHVYVGHRI